MATEFLHGRTLEPEELELIRAEIEEFGILSGRPWEDANGVIIVR
jgi:hypothetical protein